MAAGAGAMRGRGGDDAAAALRGHLLEVTRRLIGERPLSTITIRELAAAGGVSTGVLYNYFADKNELIVAALADRLDELAEGFGSGLPVAGSGALQDNVAAHLRALLELTGQVVPLGAGVISQPDLLRRLLDEAHRPDRAAGRVFGLLNDYLAAERDLGRLRDVAPEPVIALLTGVSMMIAMSHHLQPRTEAEADEEVRYVAGLLLDGIRRQPPAG